MGESFERCVPGGHLGLRERRKVLQDSEGFKRPRGRASKAGVFLVGEEQCPGKGCDSAVVSPVGGERWPRVLSFACDHFSPLPMACWLLYTMQCNVYY